MTRQQVEEHIEKTYGVTSEYPWHSAPAYAVYRHSDNRKWFAVVMDLHTSKLGLDDNRTIDVMNLKCDPFLIGSLLPEKGFYPAYHMNKDKWITVALDGSVPDEQIEWLIDISFELTKTKIKTKKSAPVGVDEVF